MREVNSITPGQKVTPIKKSAEVVKADNRETPSAQVKTADINKEMIEQVQTQIQSVQRDLQFDIDSETGLTQVVVTDAKTDEVIRKIPADQVLALKKNMQQYLGVLLDTKA